MACSWYTITPTPSAYYAFKMILGAVCNASQASCGATSDCCDGLDCLQLGDTSNQLTCSTVPRTHLQPPCCACIATGTVLGVFYHFLLLGRLVVLLRTLTMHRHALFKSPMHAPASQLCPCLSVHPHRHTGTNAAPTAVCPASYRGAVGEGGTNFEGVVVRDEEPGLATINCTKPDSSTATPATLPIGTTKVTCTARDRQGKTGECSFDATVSACRSSAVFCFLCCNSWQLLYDSVAATYDAVRVHLGHQYLHWVGV
jgi:hypothetical protein